MRALPAVVLVLTVIIGFASARQREATDTWLQGAQQQTQEQQRTDAAKLPAKVDLASLSLARLLVVGWRSTSPGMGPIGTQMVMWKAPSNTSGQWALCDLQVIDGLGSLVDQPFSHCLALN